MSNLESWAADKGTAVKPNKIAGEMIESKNFSRNFKDTWRLSSVSLCWLNFIQAMWILCFTLTVALALKSPGNFFPKYLCVSWPCATSIISPPTSRNIWSVKAVVVKIFVFDVFRCNPTADNSSISSSIIKTNSSQCFAYNIKSSAYLTFVKISPFPRSKPQCCKQSFHLRMACCRLALNNNRLITSPCFTPRWMGKVFPFTSPAWLQYSAARSFKYGRDTPCDCKAPNNDEYSMRSNAFFRSKLANQTGKFHSKDLLQTLSNTTKASSTLVHGRNPTWSLDWCLSNVGLNRL